MVNNWTSKKPKNPMPLSERAKIFAPFSALKGLTEALTAKEKIHVPKVVLTEAAEEDLNQKLRSLSVHDTVTVIYYHLDHQKKGEYLQMTGIVSKIDLISRILTIVDTKISMDDIRDMDIHE